MCGRVIVCVLLICVRVCGHVFGLSVAVLNVCEITVGSLFNKRNCSFYYCEINLNVTLFLSRYILFGPLR